MRKKVRPVNAVLNHVWIGGDFMPGRDGTGPMGMGRATGRGAGDCTGSAARDAANPVGFARGFGRGFGLGRGRGLGRGYGNMFRTAGRFGRMCFGFPRYAESGKASLDEKAFLTDQAAFLEDQLQSVKKRLSSMNTEDK